MAQHVCVVVGIAASLIFGLCSLGIIAYGGYAANDLNIDDYSRVSDWNRYLIDKLCILIGIVCLIVSITSCCCMSGSGCAMVTHGIIWFLLLLSVIFTAAFIDTGVKSKVRSGMEATMKQYLTNGAVNKSWDMIQENNECCGITNATDWIDSSPAFDASQPYPISCICKTSPMCRKTGTPYVMVFPDGCLAAVTSIYSTRWVLWRGLAIGLAVFLVLLAIANCCGTNPKNKGHNVVHI